MSGPKGWRFMHVGAWEGVRSNAGGVCLFSMSFGSFLGFCERLRSAARTSEQKLKKLTRYCV
jgi:hypothetical protein